MSKELLNEFFLTNRRIGTLISIHLIGTKLSNQKMGYYVPIQSKAVLLNRDLNRKSKILRSISNRDSYGKISFHELNTYNVHK